MKGLRQRQLVIKQLVEECHAKTVVELGLWDGKTARNVLEMCPQIERYIGVDHFRMGPNDEVTKWSQADHDQHLAACRHLAWTEKRFHLVIGDTAGAASMFTSPFVDVLFIDGDHSADGVERDINAWSRLISKDGVISGHDWNWTTVQEGVGRAMKGKNVLATGVDNVWVVA